MFGRVVGQEKEGGRTIGEPQQRQHVEDAGPASEGAVGAEERRQVQAGQVTVRIAQVRHAQEHVDVARAAPLRDDVGPRW